MEMLWLANKRASPAKIRTKALIYLGNQKAKKAWSCNLSLMWVVLSVIMNLMVSLSFTTDLLTKDLEHE